MTPPPITGWAVVLATGGAHFSNWGDENQAWLSAYTRFSANPPSSAMFEKWHVAQIAAGARAYRAELRAVDDEAQIVPLGYVAMPRNRLKP